MTDTRLILHVHGTESDVTELSRASVREALAQGKLSQSQLIWSPADNRWKEAKDFPDLQAIPAVPPAPRPVVAPSLAAVPQVRQTSASAKTVGQTVAVTAKAPQMGTAAPAASQRQLTPAAARISTIYVKDHAIQSPKGDSNPFKWVCIILGVLILTIVLVNYRFVDQPLHTTFDGTYFARVPVYAHLGAFVQPNFLVIHISPDASITNDTLSEFMATLAASTPGNPLTGKVFDRVAITSGWTAQYSFSGASWKQLGTMQRGYQTDRDDFLMAQLDDASGRSLAPEKTLSDTDREVKRQHVWRSFLDHFRPVP